MSTSQTPSKACCTVPAVVTQGYQHKGNYNEVAGMKTYVTGPSDAKHAILFVMDIFGFFEQSVQGADILGFGDKEKPYQVYMPDWFDGKPADISWFPPDNDEKGKKLGEFFSTQGAPPKTLERIPKVIDELKKGSAKGVESWAIVGFCWGGKVATLSCQKDTLFKVGAAVHPAMVDPKDAPGVSIPFAILPSGDEDKNDVAKFEEGLKVKNKVEWYPDQVHGWMGARSDLQDPNVKKNYEKGYESLLNWFHENV